MGRAEALVLALALAGSAGATPDYQDLGVAGAYGQDGGAPDGTDIAFSAKGIKLKGTLEILPKAIEMDLDVPFLLKPFKKKAISVIDEETKKWIAKAKAGEI